MWCLCVPEDDEQYFDIKITICFRVLRTVYVHQKIKRNLKLHTLLNLKAASYILKFETFIWKSYDI